MLRGERCPALREGARNVCQETGKSDEMRGYCPIADYTNSQCRFTSEAVHPGFALKWRQILAERQKEKKLG